MRKIINGKIYLSYLHLTELFDLSDVEVIGPFYCCGNNFTNLKGAPHTVRGDFWCYQSNLTSLEGAPHTVYGEFNCCGNNLTNLKGAPKTVIGDFNCIDNKLTSLEGLPETIYGNFYLDAYIKDKFSDEYIRSRCKLTGHIRYHD